MTGPVELNPELLNQAQTKTELVQSRLTSAINNLVASTDGKGEPWGTDRVGSQFAGTEGENKYLGARKNLHDLAATMNESVGNNADGQGQANKKLTNTDEASANALK